MRNFATVLALLIVFPVFAFAQTPLIVSTSPTQNELNVILSSNISVTFDIDMDAATINDSTFLVNGMSTGLHEGTITYDGPSKTATFDPDGDFAAGEIVTIVLTSGIESSGGTPLADFAWSFTTVSALAPGMFDLRSTYAAGDDPYSVYAADLDGDGDLDLAAVNRSLDRVSVLMNNGDGSFASPVNYVTSDQPVSVIAADLDGDGDIDLVTANYGSNNVSVLVNNGDGTFWGYPYVVGQGPFSVVAADLDGDGDLDLATANYDANSITILMNNGNGSFFYYTTCAAGSIPFSLAAADLDGDGDLDLAIVNRNSDNVSVLLNNGNGTFAAQIAYAVGDGPLSVRANDLDGDGDMDLATANYYSNNASVLFNNGDGTFASSISYDTGLNTHSIFSADLDGDGDLDLATANFGSDNISVLSNNGGGSFASHIVYPAGNDPTSIFAADLNGNGRIDLATANYGSDNVSVLLNAIEPVIIATDPPQNELNVEASSNISITFNTDMDAATINDSTLLVYGMSSGLHEGTITYDGPSKTATFDPDGDFAAGEIVTVVLTAAIKSSVGWSITDFAWSFRTAADGGSGTFAPQATYAAGDVPRSIYAADLDGDGDLDLAAVNINSDNVSVLLNNGDGTFAAQVTYAAGDAPRSVFAADLDGDGDLDLATANVMYDNVSVLSNNGDGTFATQVTYAAGDYPNSVFAADLDGDGDLDLATANQNSDNVSVFMNNGDGSFAPQTTYAAGDYPQSVFAADLDGDGDLDLTTANGWSDNVSVLFNNGDGSFAYRVNYAAGDGPFSVFAADLDGDGDLDLAAVNINSDNVSVLLNNGDGTFAAQVTYAAGDGPNSVFAADLDGDGDLDLATANWSSDNVSVLFNIDLPGAVTGTVTDGAMGPVEGVIVFALGTTIEDTTDIYGTYTLNSLEAGFHDISFSHEDYFDTVVTGIEVTAGDTTLLDVTMEELPGLLSGTVTNEESQPIESVYVEINTAAVVIAGVVNNHSEGNAKPASDDRSGGGLLLETVDSVYTDENGYYEFTVDAGSYDLSFSHQDYNDTACAGISVTPGDTTVVDVEMDEPPGLLCGTVTDEGSQPIESVYVEINTTVVSLSGGKPADGLLLEVPDSVYTDENGYYEFTVDAGSYDLSFSHQDYNDTTCTGMAVTPGDTTVLDVQLVSSGYAYLPGDANMSVGSWPPLVIGGDVTYLVNYFRGISNACLLGGFYCAGDANGDCNVIGSDVTRMVTYFRGLAEITPCPDYSPTWPTPDDLPEEAPDGWPNCETPPVSATIINGSTEK